MRRVFGTGMEEPTASLSLSLLSSLSSLSFCCCVYQCSFWCYTYTHTHQKWVNPMAAAVAASVTHAQDEEEED